MEVLYKQQYLSAIDVNGKAIPITGLDRPWGFEEFEGPIFQNNRLMKVVRLSALRTTLLYPYEIFLALITLRGWLRVRINVILSRVRVTIVAVQNQKYFMLCLDLVTQHSKPMRHIFDHLWPGRICYFFPTISPTARISRKSYFEFLCDFGRKNFRFVHKMSVRLSAWNNSAPNGRIWYLSIFRKSVQEIKFP
jgi:hypothetical protein